MKRKLGLLRLVHDLSSDQSGSIVLQFTIAMGAILGMIGLALDGGRFFMVRRRIETSASCYGLG